MTKNGDDVKSMVFEISSVVTRNYGTDASSFRVGIMQHVVLQLLKDIICHYYSFKITVV